LGSSNFAETFHSYPQPYAGYPDLDSMPFELPSVLVPPEIIELDGLSSDSGDEVQVKTEEWPEYTLRLFENDVWILAISI
jgi:nuclear cap-binding protein subunit 1